MKRSRQRDQIMKCVTVEVKEGIEVKEGRQEGSKQYTLESSKLLLT
jgi:hypothetical protein